MKARLMKRCVARLAAAALLSMSAATMSACSTSEKPATAALTPEQQKLNVDSFDQVWTTIRDRHFDATLGGLDWNALRDELRPKVASATTQSEARGHISDLIDRLGQSHFGIIPAAAYEDVAGRPTDAEPSEGNARAGTSGGNEAGGSKPGGDKAAAPESGSRESGWSGLWVRAVEGDVLVTHVVKGSPAEAAGIRAGHLVRSVDGRDLRAVLTRVGEAYAGKETAQSTLSFAAQSALSGSAGERVSLGIVDERDAERTIELVLAKPAGKATTLGSLPTIFVEFESRRITRPDGSQIGYVWFSSFLDPENLMAQISSALRSFRDCQGVIIDMRGNIGGLGAMAMGVGSFFVTQPATLGEMQSRNGSIRFVVNPRSNPLQTPLAVLIDECSVSTAEIFAGGMRDIGRAKLFGVRTAAAALPSTVERLPNGDGFQYAFANYISASGLVLEGNGVPPDVAAAPSRADLLAGRDPAIEAAAAWIGSGGQLPARAPVQ